MERRRVGRTDLELSVVGLGTAQLVMMPRRDAVAALARGFALGANWVHSAPDYGEVEPWIADAIAASGRDVHVLAQGPGPLNLLEPYFEHTRTLFRRKRLALYGLGCVDDLERVGENVWGAGGMVEFLLAKKRAGELGGIFCTTHGSAEYVLKLIRSGVFDAIMLALNPVGFHLLTYNPPAEEGRTFEHIPDVRTQVLPVAVEHGVSILAMKALGGGLLSSGRAFPPHEWLASPAPPLAAGDLLKYALAEPGVCGVVVGCASLEEVEENVRAGHAPIELTAARKQLVERTAARLRLTLCSRCGACESTCSRSLPISFMFRDAYIWNYRTEAFMADDRFDYFRLHSDDALACATCDDRTCLCPQGLDVPNALARVHANVHQLAAAGHRPGKHGTVDTGANGHDSQVRVLSHDVPARMGAGSRAVARFVVENTSDAIWLAPQYTRRKADASEMVVSIGERLAGRTALRTNVSPGQRSMLLVEFAAPGTVGRHDMRVAIAPMMRSRDPGRTSTLYRGELTVERRHDGVLGRRVARHGVRVAKHVLAKTTSARAPTDPPIADRHPRAVRYVEHTIPTRLRAGVTGGYQVTIENQGSLTWRAQPPDGRATEVVISIDGMTYAVLALPRATIEPGAIVTLHFALRAPEHEGRHRIEIDLVQRPGLRFSLDGAESLILDIEVERAAVTASAHSSEIALAHNLWYFQPTSGIQAGKDGRTYPLFVAKAKGCHVWDPEGRQYIDYSMSWGATILGHAEDRVQAAIRDKLDSGALPPFPDPLEMTVTRMIVEDFPGAEMVVFGKNGSDACTVAARLARLSTGKRTILSCGFHGWQDFALDHFSFAQSGIPDRPDTIFHKFGFNDRPDFARVFESCKEDLAAVMIEPAGPFMGPDAGMGGEADAEFLGEIADAVRRAKALLIFDEIITGYRYRQGSVQKATGIVPDLTCLGKALASGMPLSAVTGAAHIFHTAFARTHYCPTFKGEVYSFAAANAAIGIYRAEPVIDHIWQHGERLRAGVHRLATDVGIAVECKGPPFRMGVHFPGDPEQRRRKRTLFMQEMLKGGVITVTGVMLPSYAHDKATMDRALDVIGAALEVVAWADHAGAYDRLIEIPLL